MISAETRMAGLTYGEEIMIIGQTMWTQCTSVTDVQTDRRTDRITITKTVQRIASHGKNANKNLSTEASSRRIHPVCVDFGTAEGKYGLYTEDVDDCTGGLLCDVCPGKK